MIVVGSSGVGKSCLLLRFIDGKFSDTFISTIGVDFKSKTMHINGKSIKIQVWDTAGQERFKSIAPCYYRASSCVVIVFDVTNYESFDAIRQIYNDVNSQTESYPDFLLIGNKADLVDLRVISVIQAQKLATELNMDYYETSAKNDISVQTAFDSIIRRTVNRLELIEFDTNPNKHLYHKDDASKLKDCCK